MIKKSYRSIVVVRILIISFLSAYYSLLSTCASASNGKHLKVGDISMYVEERGKGEPVFFYTAEWGVRIPGLIKCRCFRKLIV